MVTLAAIAMATTCFGQQIDGAALFAAANAKLDASQTVSGIGVMTMDGGNAQNKIRVAFKYKKPGCGTMQILEGPGNMVGTRMVSNGKTSWSINEPEKSFITIEGQPAFPLPGFERALETKLTEKVKAATWETVDGRNLAKIEIERAPGVFPKQVWIDVSSNQVVRAAEGGRMTVDYTNVVFDEPIDDSLFTFVPGNEYKEQDNGMAELEAKLLKVGSKAPNWTLKMPNGKMMSLTQALKGKKALVLNFWFYG